MAAIAEWWPRALSQLGPGPWWSLGFLLGVGKANRLMAEHLVILTSLEKNPFEHVFQRFYDRLPRVPSHGNNLFEHVVNSDIVHPGMFHLSPPSCLRCKGTWYMVKHLHWWSRSPISESHGGHGGHDFGGWILHVEGISFIFRNFQVFMPGATPAATQVLTSAIYFYPAVDESCNILPFLWLKQHVIIIFMLECFLSYNYRRWTTQ